VLDGHPAASLPRKGAGLSTSELAHVGLLWRNGSMDEDATW